ncbi:MAG: AEC family transporter [Calditrichia bacterium]
MIILNTLFPVFAVIGLGVLLKRYQLTSEAFLKTADRLVYFIFYPALLFWKIGGATEVVNPALSIAALITVLVMFAISAIAIKIFGITAFQAGSFSQSCYRFNSYVGMAVVFNAIGESGMRELGILIGVVIPVVNVFAVATLIWFNGQSISHAKRLQFTIQAVITNPLILSCIAGFGYSRMANGFPEFLDNTLQMMATISLPLALISIGGALSFESIRQYTRISAVATVIKLLIFPVIGFFTMQWFHITGEAFKVGMIFFALPTSTAIYVLSSQLNSDTQLASAAIVLSTIISFFSLSIVLLM